MSLQSFVPFCAGLVTIVTSPCVLGFEIIYVFIAVIATMSDNADYICKYMVVHLRLSLTKNASASESS